MIAVKNPWENMIEFQNAFPFEYLLHSQMQPANTQSISFEIFVFSFPTKVALISFYWKQSFTHSLNFGAAV